MPQKQLQKQRDAPRVAKLKLPYDKMPQPFSIRIVKRINKKLNNNANITHLYNSCGYNNCLNFTSTNARVAELQASSGHCNSSRKNDETEGQKCKNGHAHPETQESVNEQKRQVQNILDNILRCSPGIARQHARPNCSEDNCECLEQNESVNPPKQESSAGQAQSDSVSEKLLLMEQHLSEADKPPESQEQEKEPQKALFPTEQELRSIRGAQLLARNMEGQQCAVAKCPLQPISECENGEKQLQIGLNFQQIYKLNHQKEVFDSKFNQLRKL